MLICLASKTIHAECFWKLCTADIIGLVREFNAADETRLWMFREPRIQQAWPGETQHPVRTYTNTLQITAEVHVGSNLVDTVQGTDENEVAGDNYRAIRPTYSPHLNWTAGHSSYELSLSDSESSPCEVFAAGWEKGDHQKWKIVSQEESSRQRSTTQVTVPSKPPAFALVLSIQVVQLMALTGDHNMAAPKAAADAATKAAADHPTKLQPQLHAEWWTQLGNLFFAAIPWTACYSKLASYLVLDSLIKLALLCVGGCACPDTLFCFTVPLCYLCHYRLNTVTMRIACSASGSTGAMPSLA